MTQSACRAKSRAVSARPADCHLHFQRPNRKRSQQSQAHGVICARDAPITCPSLHETKYVDIYAPGRGYGFLASASLAGCFRRSREPKASTRIPHLTRTRTEPQSRILISWRE
jgi:hypothetical protein